MERIELKGEYYFASVDTDDNWWEITDPYNQQPFGMVDRATAEEFAEAMNAPSPTDLALAEKNKRLREALEAMLPLANKHYERLIADSDKDEAEALEQPIDDAFAALANARDETAVRDE